MIDLEPVIRTDLEGAVPLPPAELADWGDVLARAKLHPHGRRRRLAALLAAVLVAASVFAVVTPLGGAIVQGVGDFSSWLSGQPGEPAPPAEQAAFQAANERSWSGFAPDAQLRRLIVTEASGTRFTLYGFRSGGELCLRLVARGDAPGSETHCAPVHALQTAKTPAVVVAADVGFGLEKRVPPPGEYLPVEEQATFGIASDGVARIILDAGHGAHDALIGGNAFLYIADHPKAGTRVRSVKAVAADGSRMVLGFESAPFGDLDLPQPPTGKPQGPSRVERRVRGGTIGWIARLEPRGEPLPAEIRERVVKMSSRVLRGSPLLARAIRPDAGEPGAIAVVAGSPTGRMDDPDAALCVFSISSAGMGGGCGPFARIFEREPFTVGLGGSGASQYTRLSGLASDDVHELHVFLSSGEIVDAPLLDNAYRTQLARSDFPIRIVAYDGEDRVIGIQTFASDGMTNPAPPEARSSVRELVRVTADGGAVGVLRAGTPAGGYRCWHADFSDGSGGGGCTPWPYKGPMLGGISTPRVDNDTFLAGQVESDIARLTVTYADGEVATIIPLDGLVLYAVPSHHLTDGHEVIAVRGYDANGSQVAQRGIRLR